MSDAVLAAIEGRITGEQDPLGLKKEDTWAGETDMDVGISAVANKGFPPSYRVRKPTEVKKRVLKSGAHICEGEPGMANKDQHLIEKYAVIWTDQEVIEMPLGEQVEIPLTEN